MPRLFNLRGGLNYPTPSDGPYVIDWLNPITKDLVACFVPGLTLGDMTGVGQSLITISTTTFNQTIDGPGLGDTAGTAITQVTDNRLVTFTNASVFVREYNTAAQNSAMFFGTVTNGGAAVALAIGGVSASLVQAAIYYNGASFTAVGTTTISSNSHHNLLATQANTTGTLYIDGAQAFSGAITAPSGLVTADNNFGNAPSTTCICYYFWLRQLSAAEATYLDRNPYCFLVPKYDVWSIRASNSRNIWVPNPNPIMPDWW